VFTVAIRKKLREVWVGAKRWCLIIHKIVLVSTGRNNNTVMPGGAQRRLPTLGNGALVGKKL